MARLQISLRVLVVLVCGCASKPVHDFYHPSNGAWRTKIQTAGGYWLAHGVMTFAGENQATYAFHNGRIGFKEINVDQQWR